MVKIDEKEIMRLRDAGMTHQKIADTLHCSTGLVKKVLDEKGYLSKFLTFERSTCKHPILLAEIIEKRESLRIGQNVYVDLRRENDDFKIEKSEQKCTVKEKYPHFCLVEDRRGHRECILYVDLVMKERAV